MASRRGKQSNVDATSGDAGRGGRNAERASDREPDDGPRSFTALPELMRKAFAAGLSGFFLTEEALRKALGETLPKDWSDFALDQSRRTRAEFLERLSFELGRALENVDLAAVLSQLLEGRTLEIRTQVRLGEREAGAREAPRLQVETSTTLESDE